MSARTLPSQMMGLILVLLLTAACGAPAPATAPEIRAKTWNLVVMGGSKSWGVGKLYAADIEADENVKDAEVIIFEASALDYTGTGFFEEGSSFECSAKAMASYKADLDAIVAEILALRKGKPTLIRTMDL